MFTDTLDELRTWPTERLRASRDEATREERRWQLRRIAMDRVLDERGATDACDAVEWVAARDGVRTQTARAEVEVARALDALPAIAAAAETGALSIGTSSGRSCSSPLPRRMPPGPTVRRRPRLRTWPGWPSVSGS